MSTLTIYFKNKYGFCKKKDNSNYENNMEQYLK